MPRYSYNNIIIIGHVIILEFLSVQYSKLRPASSKPGVLYDLVKVHKKFIDDYPIFRPTLSAIGTPTYKIAKLFDPILKDLTSNEYSVKAL